MSKLKLKIKPENFSLFVSKIENIAAIDDTVRVKIDSENILMYSMLGGGNVMLAFKNFLLKTSDFFDIDDFDYTLWLDPNGSPCYRVKKPNIVRSHN